MPGLPSSILKKQGTGNLILQLLLICVMPLLATAQDKYGLAFASKRIAPEARTSLALFPENPLLADNSFSLAFDLSLASYYPSYFGYVFRIIDNKDQNIDLIFDVHTRSFNVVTGNEFSGISFQPDIQKISHEWQHVQLDINIKEHNIRLLLDGKPAGTARLNMAMGKQFRIFFGANHYKELKAFDLTPMRLKDVKIYREKTLLHHWVLNRSTGDTDTDIISQQKAKINNPIWLARTYREWNKPHDFTVKGNASVMFDNNSGILYINSNDSIYNYTTTFNEIHSIPLSKERVLPAGNTTILDQQTKQVYNFLVDEKEVARYDTAQRTWDNAITSHSMDRYWHANSFFSQADSAIYVIGGYGDYRFKNDVQRYSTVTKTWDTLSVKGDRFTPRYLAALGTNVTGDSAYILGGYGSLRGDQLLNPHNFYDLTLFDVKTKTFKKIYQLADPEQPFAFGNSMIIDNSEQCYYALTLTNDKTASAFQLIKGSLTKPEYVKLAGEIPLQYNDLKSTVDLFYDKKNEKLIAVNLYSSDNRTRVQIYTIFFPPAMLEVHAAAPVSYVSGILICLILVAGIALYSIPKKKTEEIETPAPEPVIIEKAAPVLVPVNVHHAAIYLFGDFTVLDKNGEDISKLFSPLLKELFLLLLLHSTPGKHGISSEKINEILWTGRSVKDAKNNRSVNMVKLKSILDRIGDYTLVKENGRWLLHFDNNIHIDIQQYYQLLHTDQVEPLTQVTGRGIFLPETEYSWLDKFKSDIAAEVMPIFISFLEEQSTTLHPEFIITVCNCILNFDSLSEEAIMFKCRALVALRQHSSARTIYSSFTKEYQTIYGETFEKDYMEVLEQY